METQYNKENKLVDFLAGALAFVAPFFIFGGCQSREVPKESSELTKIVESKRYYINKKGEDRFYKVYVDEKPFGSLDYVENHSIRNKNPKIYAPVRIEFPNQEEINYFNEIKTDEIR